MTADLIREAIGASYSLRDLLRQPELASTVDRLVDALERAEKERDEAGSVTCCGGAHARDWLLNHECPGCQLDRLRAENERLRADLRLIASQDTREGDRAHDATLVARRALGLPPELTPALTDHYSVTVRADGDILREEPK